MATYGIEDYLRGINQPFLPTVRGGAVDNSVTWPWQTSIGTNNWNAPQYAGGISPTMVDTTQVSVPKGSSIPGAPWSLDSGYRSNNELLAMLGDAAAPARLAAAPAYAPWGATSRSLAYNALNPAQPTAVAAMDPAQAAIDAYMANPPDFKGRDKGNAALGSYGGETAPKSKARGLSGLLASLFQQPSTAVGTKRDTRGPSPADRYATRNAAAQLNAILAPRTGNAGGYSYVNGQKTGYAPISAGGASITPTSGAQAYSLANEAGKIRAIANSAEPSKAAARASLASQWGFD